MKVLPCHGMQCAFSYQLCPQKPLVLTPVLSMVHRPSSHTRVHSDTYFDGWHTHSGPHNLLTHALLVRAGDLLGPITDGGELYKLRHKLVRVHVYPLDPDTDPERVRLRNADRRAVERAVSAAEKQRKADRERTKKYMMYEERVSP